jgi:glycosyltransferase involved in cell wall biosynthesis
MYPLKMRRILVFAHVPPPHHGQSVMVSILLKGLRADTRFEVHHVDARISDDLGDVGSLRPQKFLRLFKCILQAWWIRLRFGRMAFYYVPAPVKCSAILRDWLVMALCRPLFPELILHWHAYGLGEWAAAGKDWQRRLTRFALGKADLSIVLNEYNRRDAAVFDPERIEVVPNGITDQFPDYDQRLRARRETRAIRLRQLGLRRENEDLEIVSFLFLGHLMESKGVFLAIEATKMANEELRRSNAAWRAHLTLAGSFASEGEAVRVQGAMEAANRFGGTEGPCVTLAGFLDSGQKKSALEKADCLLFPTFYEGETQGLVLLEAMSAGLPVITTSWRGIAEVLPINYRYIINPRSARKLSAAMLDLAFSDYSDLLRSRFESAFNLPHHVAAMRRELVVTTRERIRSISER